jgi:hypothetical protein
MPSGVFRNGQTAQTFSGGGKNGVGHGGGHGRTARLAHATGVLAAGHDVDLNVESLAKASRFLKAAIDWGAWGFEFLEGLQRSFLKRSARVV